MLSIKATNTNFIVFSLTRSGLELTIYCARGEHANYYTTEAVKMDGNNKILLSDALFIHPFSDPFFMLNKAICLDIFHLFSNVVELTYQINKGKIKIH